MFMPPHLKFDPTKNFGPEKLQETFFNFRKNSEKKKFRKKLLNRTPPEKYSLSSVQNN